MEGQLPDNGVPTPQPAVPGMEGQPNMQQPIQQPIVQPQIVQPAPQFSAGGKTGMAKWFDGISLMDVVIGSLAIGTLALIAWHYKNKIKFAKVEYPELRNSVEELKKEVDDMKPEEAAPTKQSDAFSF